MAENYTDKISEKIELQRKREKGYLYIITRIYVLFILVLYPLYVGNDGYNDIVNQKASLYWATTITFLIIFMLFFTVYKLGCGKGENSRPFWKQLSVPDFAAMTFFLIITLSSLLSPYQNKVWLGMVNRRDGWLTYACMLVSFFIISRWYKPKKSDFIAFGASSMMVCIYGFFQFYGFDFLNFFPHTQSNMIDGNGNPFYSGFSIQYRTTIGNTNFVGIYVCICIVLFGILYVKTKEKIRYFYFAVSVMNFVLRIISQSDAAIIGVFGAIILLIPYWISEKRLLGRFLIISSAYGFAYFIHQRILITKVLPNITEESPIGDHTFKNMHSTLPLNPILILSLCGLLLGIIILCIRISWPKTKVTRVVGVTIIVILTGCAIGGIEVMGKRFAETNMIYQAREIMHGNVEDSFGSQRIFIWKRALLRVSETPALGTGPDTFLEAFGEKNISEGVELHKVRYDKAHNDFIQILLCTGIPGLISYITLITSILVIFIKKASEYEPDAFSFPLVGAILAYLGQSFFGIDTVIVTPLFWLLLAMLQGRQIVKQ